MEMNLTISAESDLLRVNATGEFSLEEAKRTFLEVLDAATQYNSAKVLFDGRDVVGAPTTMERFFYAEFAAQAVMDLIQRGIPHIPRIAYVLLPPVLDPQRFGETVAVNRGLVVRVFDNLESALEWLDLAPANTLEQE